MISILFYFADPQEHYLPEAQLKGTRVMRDQKTVKVYPIHGPPLSVHCGHFKTALAVVDLLTTVAVQGLRPLEGVMTPDPGWAGRFNLNKLIDQLDEKHRALDEADPED